MTFADIAITQQLRMQALQMAQVIWLKDTEEDFLDIADAIYQFIIKEDGQDEG